MLIQCPGAAQASSYSTSLLARGVRVRFGMYRDSFFFLLSFVTKKVLKFKFSTFFKKSTLKYIEPDILFSLSRRQIVPVATTP